MSSDRSVEELSSDESKVHSSIREADVEADKSESGFGSFLRAGASFVGSLVTGQLNDSSEHIEESTPDDSEIPDSDMATPNLQAIQATIRVQKLTSQTAWLPWKKDMENLLTIFGLFDIVKEKRKASTTTDENAKKKEDAEFMVLDRTAQLKISEAIDDKHRVQLESCATAHEMWSFLISKYEERNVSDVFTRFRDNLQYKWSDAEDIQTFCSKIRSFDKEARDAKFTISHAFMGVVINACPEDKMYLVQSWANLPKDERTLDNLLDTLQNYVKGKSDGVASACSASASYSKSNQSAGNRDSKNNGNRNQHRNRNFDRKNRDSQSDSASRREKKPVDKSTLRCHNCGGMGHFRKDCPSPRRQPVETPPVEKEGKPVTASLAMALGADCGESTSNLEDGWSYWCVDSGATHHMCRDADIFETISPCPELKNVTTVNGYKIPIHGMGNVVVTAQVDGQPSEICLHDVLYVPGIVQNLISLSACLQRGNRASSERDGLTFVNGSGNAYMRAQLVERLYRVALKSCGQAEANAAISTDDNRDDGKVPGSQVISDSQLWHERLVHVNHSRIKSLQSAARGFKLKDTLTTTCHSCLQGKACLLPFNNREGRKCKPGEYLHMDLAGPYPRSFDGHLLFMAVKDDASGYTFVKPLKKKSDAFDALKEVIATAERDTSRNVKWLRSDGGGEFVNNEMKKYLSDKKIFHEISTPHTPQLNGTAERNNRTLMEAVRSVMIFRKIPVSLE